MDDFPGLSDYTIPSQQRGSIGGGSSTADDFSVHQAERSSGGDFLDSLRNFLGHSITEIFVEERPPVRRSMSVPRSRMPQSAALKPPPQKQQPDGQAQQPQPRERAEQAGQEHPSPRGAGLLNVVMSGITSFSQRTTTLLNRLDADFDSMFNPDEMLAGSGSGGASPALPWHLTSDVGLRRAGNHGSATAGNNDAVRKLDQKQPPQPATASPTAPPDAAALLKGRTARSELVARRSLALPAAAGKAMGAPEQHRADAAVLPTQPAGAAARNAATSRPKAAAPSLVADAAATTVATSAEAGTASLTALGCSATSTPASSASTPAAATAAAAAAEPLPPVSTMDATQLRIEVLRLRKDVKRLALELQASGRRRARLELENSRLRGAEVLDPAVCEPVRRQLQALLADKARLVQRNAALAAEAAGLRELLQFATQPPDSDDFDNDIDSGCDMAAGFGTPAATAAGGGGWDFVGAGSFSAVRRLRVDADECDVASISALHSYYSHLLGDRAEGAAMAAREDGLVDAAAGSTGESVCQEGVGEALMQLTGNGTAQQDAALATLAALATTAAAADQAVHLPAHELDASDCGAEVDVAVLLSPPVVCALEGGTPPGGAATAAAPAHTSAVETSVAAAVQRDADGVAGRTIPTAHKSAVADERGCSAEWVAPEQLDDDDSCNACALEEGVASPEAIVSFKPPLAAVVVASNGDAADLATGTCPTGMRSWGRGLGASSLSQPDVQQQDVALQRCKSHGQPVSRDSETC